MEATSPVGYVPPPLVDSSIGNPGAFTDPDEELPQPAPVSDPYMPPKPESVKGAPSTRAPSVRDVPLSVSAPKSEAKVPPQKEPELEPPTTRDVTRSALAPQDAPTQDVPVIQDVPVSIPEPEPAPTPAPAQPAETDAPVRVPTPSFDKPTGAAMGKPDPSIAQPSQPAPSATPPSGFVEAVDDTTLGNDKPSEPAVDPAVPVPAPIIPVPPIPVDITGFYHPMPVPAHEQQPAPVGGEAKSSNGPVFRAMPIDELNSGSEIWGGVPRSNDQPKSNGSASHGIPTIK